MLLGYHIICNIALEFMCIHRIEDSYGLINGNKDMHIHTDRYVNSCSGIAWNLQVGKELKVNCLKIVWRRLEESIRWLEEDLKKACRRFEEGLKKAWRRLEEG